MSVRQLLYTSQATVAFKDRDCESILRASRTNNAENGLTGFLIYLANGTFLQVLEGPADRVEATLRRIAGDPRHGKMITSFDTIAPAREFDNGSMGFKSMNTQELAEMPEFRNLDAKGDFDKAFAQGPLVLSVMKTICYANLGRTPSN